MNCESHPDRAGVTSIYSEAHEWRRILLCKECSDTLHPFGRAYGTGLSMDAHAEAQEAGRYEKEYQDSKPHAKVRKYL
jgi:hypothetical protein